jgi:hypothetical protein
MWVLAADCSMTLAKLSGGLELVWMSDFLLVCADAPLRSLMLQQENR